MFWRMTGFSTPSAVDSLLNKETCTLEDLFDEEEIIQECKGLNNRLINFLRDRERVQHMIRYIVEEPPENAESRRCFRFPFIACEIFSCEIDAILKTLIEDEELMNLLFSFLESDRPHRTLLAGYFSKVVISLLLRKTIATMRYIQAHQEILGKLVNLIGITSVMEVVIRLVGADDHMYTYHIDPLQWLADTNLLEMLIDALSSTNSPEVHANSAETLCAIARLAPSALSTKLSSPSFLGRLLHNALENPQSKSTLVHSLSVCISLLNPNRSNPAAVGAARGNHITEPVMIANPEIVDGMLQRLDMYRARSVTEKKQKILKGQKTDIIGEDEKDTRNGALNLESRVYKCNLELELKQTKLDQLRPLRVKEYRCLLQSRKL